jgi:hypothetical protein
MVDASIRYFSSESSIGVDETGVEAVIECCGAMGREVVSWSNPETP